MITEFLRRHGCNRYLLLANVAEAAFVMTLFLEHLVAAGIILHLAGACLLRMGTASESTACPALSGRREFTCSLTKGARDGDVNVMPIAMFYRYSLLIGLFFPIFGIPGVTLFIFITHYEESRRAKVIEEYTSHISPNIARRPRYERIDVFEAARRELDVEPVVDLLTSQDRHLLWGSIEVLSRRTDEKSIRMIRETLDRQDMDVKFYSAWGLDRIERRFRTRRKALEKVLETDFHLPTAIELLETISHAIKSRFYQGPLLGKLIEDGLALADRTTAAFPDDPLAASYQAVFLVESERTDEARATFQRLIDHQALLPAFIPDAAEVFFRHREFGTVRMLIELLAQSPENEVFLSCRALEASLEDLGDFWLKDRETRE